MALRKEKMLKKSLKTPDATAKSITQPISLTSRIMNSAEESRRSNRQKRSTIPNEISRNGWGMAFAKKRITWRLVSENVARN